MMTVMARKIGGSVAVVIPKALASEMGLTDGTPLDITGGADGIVMRRRGRRPRRNLKSIVEQIKPSSYRRRNQWASDAPVGKEIW
jgi:antitoxin component of MazEF toxin-antitoxin module